MLFEFLTTVLGALTGSDSADASGGPYGSPTTRRLPKTQGTRYFNKPSRGLFGTNTGSPRSPHASIEEVARAAGVSPYSTRESLPAPPPVQGAAPAADARPRRSVPPPGC